MNKRLCFFILAASFLATVYAYAFTDWFKPKFIQIMYRGTPDGALTFFLDRPRQLTSVRVVAASATEKYPHALWHLIADEKSKSVGDFKYGGRIRGMKPKVPRGKAESLESRQSYRIVIEAGKLKGEKEFTAP